MIHVRGHEPVEWKLRDSSRVTSRPVPSSSHVTAQMKKMPRQNTAPEVALRRSLHRLGGRYRLHRADLPGRPDVVFVAARVAVFVDGCFWHGCPDHGVMPKANRDWWQQKLSANKLRDERADRALESGGWQVVHVWEHEDMDKAAQRVLSVVRGKVTSSCEPPQPSGAGRRSPLRGSSGKRIRC
jgi:DNA mismatch endonuclease (patch repair protein)